MKLLYREGVYVAIIIFILMALALLPLLHWVALSGPDTIFPLIHNFRLDYFYYLQLMKQGLDGNWLTVSRFTPENFTPQLGMTLFPILGKLSVIFGGDLAFTYTFSRIVLGIVLLLVIYKFIGLVFPESRLKRIISFLFVSFSSTFWFVKYSEGKYLVENAFGDWTSFDTLHRAIFLPHHLLSYIAMVLVMILLFLQKKNKLSGYFMIGFFTLTSGITNPGTFLGLGFIASVVFLFILVSQRPKTFIKSYGLKILVFTLTSLVTVYYLNWLQNTNFPWTAIRDEESKWVFNISFWDYLGALGPLFFTALAGFYISVKQKVTPLRLVILVWFAAPFVALFVLSPYLPIANQRLLEWGHYIPIAILSAEAVVTISGRAGGRKLLFFVLSAFVFYSSVSVYAAIVHDFGVFNPNIYNIYLPRELFPAFGWLDDNTPENSVVLSQGYMGNMIPAYAHNKVVVGHPTLTYKSAEKDQEVGKFFLQDNIIFSKNLIDKYNVSYIFYSLDTPPPDEEFLKTLGAKVVFVNDKVKIYKVK